MMRLARPLVGLVISALLHGACAGDRNARRLPAESLPPAFGSDDAAAESAAQLEWRAFFDDPDLELLIDDALEANPDLQIAFQRVEVARAGVRRDTGVLLPRVDLVAGAEIRKFARYTIDGAGNEGVDFRPGNPIGSRSEDFSVRLETNWEIDVWGKLRNGRRAAVSRYLGTVEGANFVTTQLVSQIASDYYDLVALDRIGALLDQTVERQRDALDVVRLQKRAGRANDLAVRQFEAQLAGTRALRSETAYLALEAETNIGVLMGRFPAALERDPDALLRAVAPTLAAGIPSDLLMNRPDIRAAELEMHAAGCDVRTARAAFLPSFFIVTELGFQAFAPKFLFTTPESLLYSAAAGLVTPLVNRSAIQAEFDAASAYQVESMHVYQKTILEAYAEVHNGLAKLRTSAEVVDERHEQKSALERSVSVADALYRAGKASYVEVLLAQQNTLAAELDLIEALRARRSASIALYRALGGGWHQPTRQVAR